MSTLGTKPRILFVSGREVGYMRNRVLLAALGMHFDVTVLSVNIPSIVGRTAVSLARFLACRPDYSTCFVGFYGQPLAIALSVLQSKPIILDAYVSTFDTLCEDRGNFRPDSLIGRLTRWVDRRSCQVADRVISDTQAHARYFEERFGVPKGKIETIYVGCDESLFYPRDSVLPEPGSFEVFYYSAFLPLHGTEIIVEAANRLRHRPDIHFVIGGAGTHYKSVQRTVADLALTNLELTGWIPLERLPDHISRASLCLGGHFSRIPKAARVISTKTFQFIAMRKPTIVADNPATREILVHGEHVWTVPMGDPESLAQAIEILADNAELRHRIASGGYEIFQQRLTGRSIANELVRVIQEVTCTSAS